jgi:hypothetical protein
MDPLAQRFDHQEDFSQKLLDTSHDNHQTGAPINIQAISIEATTAMPDSAVMNKSHQDGALRICEQNSKTNLIASPSSSKSAELKNKHNDN